ncbi:unnamed protein product [Mycena citricolor]|uniref:Uncharacterized protein n=1 Tax=Mycena citricolor TaxID=2018698 RepID=A0AAD2GYK6_9AGAR|nr:unnamed protein product [Mycena citricolor]CAK5280887.1 unnamed protein product [Mycena citricolor]
MWVGRYGLLEGPECIFKVTDASAERRNTVVQVFCVREDHSMLEFEKLHLEKARWKAYRRRVGLQSVRTYRSTPSASSFVSAADPQHSVNLIPRDTFSTRDLSHEFTSRQLSQVSLTHGSVATKFQTTTFSA